MSSIDKFQPIYATTRRILKAVELDGLVLQVVNPNSITQEIAIAAVQNNRKAIDYIPDQMLDDSKFIKDIGLTKTKINEIKKRRDVESKEKDDLSDSTSICRSQVQSFDNDSFSLSQVTLKKDFNPKRIESPIISESSLSTEIVISNDARIVTVDESDEYQGRVYYISDLHIEHQIQEYITDEQVDDELIVRCIERKIRTMSIPPSTPDDILLIAGDTADSPGFINEFLNRFSYHWQGTILFVLGNHEIMYGHKVRIDSSDSYVDIYRSVIDRPREKYGSICLLHNSLYIRYKNRKEFVISEEQILESSDDELSDVISKSTFIVMGGIGFSGFMDGIIDWYDGILNKECIRFQTSRFLNIYNKISQCSGEKKVIVLTHFPLSYWNPAKDEKGSPAYNDNWIYVNGHTHNNFAFRSNNNAWIFANNQVGYKPIQWGLKSFLVKDWYDALSAYDDGIHIISKDQYVEFNFGRGIQCRGCNYSGEIIMLKREGIYMFLLKSEKSLCILNGGQRKTADSAMKEISWKQFFAIICITYCKEPPTLKELSDILGSSHQNVKQILLKLEKKSFIRFQADESDRRKQRIVLTDTCREFCEKNDDMSKVTMTNLFDGIPEKDIRTTIQTITKIERNMRREEKG